MNGRPRMRAVKPCCHQLAGCLEGPAVWECRVDRSSWDPPGALEIAGLCLHCLPSSLGTEWERCVHTGGGAGMWEEPARPQMVALPPAPPACPALGGAQWRRWGRRECLGKSEAFEEVVCVSFVLGTCVERGG